MTVRATLVEKGILPTPEQAKNAYWRLGENWWWQIIDGEHHSHGPLVFDRGLHRAEIEPGYYEGILNASLVFTDRIHEDFTLDLYRAVHYAACKHFKGKQNNTLCDASEINDFRSRLIAAYSPVYSKQFSNLEKDYESLRLKFNVLLPYFKMKSTLYECPTWVLSPKEMKEMEAGIEIHQELMREDPSLEILSDEETIDFLKKKLHRIKLDIKEHVLGFKRLVEDYFISVKERLSLVAPLTKTEILSDGLSMEFIYTVPEEKMEPIVDAFIREYNQGLAKAQRIAYDKLCAPEADLKLIKTEYLAAARKVISRLYADFEWAHPWIDGQGRTDLIAVLNGQLCREGLHPCILEYPYYSTGSLIEDWDAYLVEGLKKYVKLCESNEI